METQTTIEKAEIVNDDLIDVLATLTEFYQIEEPSPDPKLYIIGDGPVKMLTPYRGVEDADYIYGSQIVDAGELTDSVRIDGETVPLSVR